MPTTPTAQRSPGAAASTGRTPAGVRMSNVWRNPRTGTLMQGADGVEVPVDSNWNIAGWLWLCQNPACSTVIWMYAEDARPDQEFCTRHPLQLVPAQVGGDNADPVAAARTASQGRLKALYRAKRQAAVDAAAAKAEELRRESLALARRTVRELRGHAPSAAVSVTGLLAGIWATTSHEPLLVAGAGLTVGTVGAVAAYVAMYAVGRVRAQFDGADPADLIGRRGRRMRAAARRVAAGVAALGGWLLSAAACGVDPGTLPGAANLLLGAGLIWVVNRAHWDELWEKRRLLAERARLAAEEAARLAAEAAARLAAMDETVAVDESDPMVVGARMAERWRAMSADPTVPPGFDMARTRIVPEETRPLEVPGVDGAMSRIGWEFAIVADPGVLVARLGGGNPLLAARAWLASMMDRDGSTVETAAVPGKPNRAVLVLTDRLPLGEIVQWKGPAGIRRDKDGSIHGHIGRALTGEDVYEALYVPGQPSGGLTVGTTGSGKTAAMIVRFLNLLAAGIFPMLHDPKNFLDYIDFLGVFPMVALPEHRDVMLDALWCERERREKLMSTRPRQDRYKRQRRGDPVWDLRFGAPIRAVFDEFHMNARDQKFTERLTTHVRLQRASAESTDIATQGGGLADLADSNLRDLVAKVRLDLYRVSDHLARLAGYEGEYSPSSLPILPGAHLSVAACSPAVPMRSAFVTRDDVDGSVYDYLYGPDGMPLLQAPTMPDETIAVFESTGLMDLWRLGQGPDGAERLLSATNGPDVVSVPASPVVPAGGSQAAKPAAKCVVLGILYATGGVDLATQITEHDVWRTAPGWGQPPALSTVTRTALPRLLEERLVARDGERWVLSKSGRDVARQWAESLGLVRSDGSGPLPVGAVAEHDAQVRYEARLEADAVVVAP